MDIRDLQCFIKVCELESFSLAADELYMTQSSVSKSIIKLEKELDVKLFTRLHHGIRMTEAGEFLYARLAEMLPQLDQAFQEVHLYSDRSRLWVCTDVPKNIFHIDYLCELFAKRHPEVDFRIDSIENETIKESEKYDSARYDYVLTHRIPDLQVDQKHALLHLHDDSVFAIVPKKNPLADAKVLRLQDLLGQHIVYKSAHIEHLLDDIDKHWHLRFDTENIGSKYNTRQLVMGHLEHIDAITLFFKSDLDIFSFETVKVIPIEELVDFPMVLLHASNNLNGDVYRQFEAFLVKNIKDITASI